MKKPLHIGLVTKEWPPHIYGGAGVHVRYLTESLQQKIEVSVHCFGEKRPDATGYEIDKELSVLNPAFQTVITDMEIARNLNDVQLVHSHTWYANLAGHLAKQMYGIPHVITAHSLEPDRPWKAEQLGGGYKISSWAEKISYEGADAIIAVSQGMKRDVLRAYPTLDPTKVHAILNGINTKTYASKPNPELLARLGISGRFAIFVGRITRQKGLGHLLRAWQKANPEIGLVLAAGSPDEPGIGQEISTLIKQLQSERKDVWWFEKMLPQEDVVSLLSSADIFICPSIYEPLGIVNLEAMACETAVLASRVGGIPEVVVDKVTGELVDYDGDGEKFENLLAERISALTTNPELLEKYGKAGRGRAIENFSWETIANETISLYEDLITKNEKSHS